MDCCAECGVRLGDRDPLWLLLCLPCLLELEVKLALADADERNADPFDAPVPICGR